MAAGVVGRGARRARRTDPRRDPGGAGQRGDVPRRPSRGGRLHGARARRLGHRRPQLAHQHLLLEREGGLPLLDGARPPEPRPRRRRRDPAGERAPGVGPLLQPARAADRGGQGPRRQGHRLRRPALEHGDACRPLALAAARQRGRDPARDRRPSHPRPPLRPRLRSPLVELEGIPLGPPSGPCPCVRGLRGRARHALRRIHVRARGAGIGHRGARDRGGRRGRRAGRHAALDALLAERRRGQSRRLAGVADPLSPERASRRDCHRRRHHSERLEQVRAAADPLSAAFPLVERAHLAARVSARDERALLSAAALPEGRSRAARGLLLSSLQPGLDEPRRLHLDRGADRRVARGPSRGAHPDLERDRVLRRLRAADGGRQRAGTTSTPTRPTMRSGWASASRC